MSHRRAKKIRKELKETGVEKKKLKTPEYKGLLRRELKNKRYV